MMAYRQFLTILPKRSLLFFNKNIETLKIQSSYYASQSSNKAKPSLLSGYSKKILLAVCCFGVTGGTYAYLSAVPNRKRNFSSSLLELADPYVLAEAPDIKPSRQVSGPTNTGMKFLLYQYQTCPFCCKVRAFMDFYGIPYDVVEVNPVMRQQIKFSKYKKVPILIVQDEKTGVKLQLNDSSVIISVLGSFLLNDYEKLQDVLKYYKPIVSKDDKGKEIQEVMNQYFLMFGEKNKLADDVLQKERQWRSWADKEFVHVLSPNIYRTREEALQAFNYFSHVGDWEKNFSTFERLTVIYVGATAMYFIGKKLKKKYGLKDDVRDSLYDYCRHWMKNVGQSKFMGGDSPNLADLAVYGLLSSIEGCDAFKDLVENTNIESWFINVKEAVVQNHGHQQIKYNAQT